MLSKKLAACFSLAGATLLAGCVVPQPIDTRAPTYVQPVIAAPPTRQCDTRFVVTNRSRMPVRELYFSSSSLSSFGVNQLGRRILQPGQSVSYAANNTGAYDFRVRWTNGQTADLMRVNVCAASRITVTNRGLVAQ